MCAYSLSRFAALFQLCAAGEPRDSCVMRTGTDVDAHGDTIQFLHARGEDLCCEMCGAVDDCDVWIYGPQEPSKNCWLVKGPVTYKAVADRNSGVKPSASREVDKNIISIFGSSVSNGAFCSGNCSGTAYDPAAAAGGCYQSRLREYQAAYRGRSIFNNAHGGDTTTKLLDRFEQFLSSRAGFVFIGLSLANEGLRCGPVGDPCHQTVFDHYAAGMRELVREIRAAGSIPVVGACYPNSAYTEEEYVYIKRMNMLTAQWDLETPQVNFLGAIEDGHGRWASGYYANGGHPNDAGSTEMYYAFVPSIFDAILAGKPALPARADGSQFLRLELGASLSFTPRDEETLHSFTFSFDLRCGGCTGALALVAQKGAPDVHSLVIDAATGGIQHAAPSGAQAVSSLAVNDGAWHSVSLMHYYANGTVSLYVDGLYVSQASAKVNVKSFAIVPGASVNFRDLLIYRSGLNEQERTFNLANRTHVLHASLEVYAPLAAANPLENRAQSLSELVMRDVEDISIV